MNIVMLIMLFVSLGLNVVQWRRNAAIDRDINDVEEKLRRIEACSTGS